MNNINLNISYLTMLQAKYTNSIGYKNLHLRLAKECKLTQNEPIKNVNESQYELDS